MKKKSMKANSIRSVKKSSSGPRKIDIILPASNPIDGNPCHEKRQSLPPLMYHPPEPKKKRWKKKSAEEKKKEVSLQESLRLSILERRWRAVGEYYQKQSIDGIISSREMKRIAEDYNMTISTLKILVKKAGNGESLSRKKGSG